jgi:hypothetical protein
MKTVPTAEPRLAQPGSAYRVRFDISAAGVAAGADRPTATRT